MKSINRVLIIGIILNSGLLGCEKDSDRINSSLEGIIKDKYYGYEVFDEAYRDIYGAWKLYVVSGGIHGGGHENNFDFLTIKEFGIYAFSRNDSILEYGRIIIVEQTSETLQIRFEPDVHSKTFMYDSEKFVYLSGRDTLNLESPCCDRYNYHFNRQK